MVCYDFVKVYLSIKDKGRRDQTARAGHMKLVHFLFGSRLARP